MLRVQKGHRTGKWRYCDTCIQGRKCYKGQLQYFTGSDVNTTISTLAGITTDISGVAAEAVKLLRVLIDF